MDGPSYGKWLVLDDVAINLNMVCSISIRLDELVVVTPTQTLKFSVERVSEEEANILIKEIMNSKDVVVFKELVKSLRSS
jgi:hypothetical protein